METVEPTFQVGRQKKKIKRRTILEPAPDSFAVDSLLFLACLLACMLSGWLPGLLASPFHASQWTAPFRSSFRKLKIQSFLSALRVAFSRILFASSRLGALFFGTATTRRRGRVRRCRSGRPKAECCFLSD